MAQAPDKPLLLRVIGLGALGSLAGAAVMLAVAIASWPLGGVRAQILLTFIALFLGLLLMQVQLQARRRYARRRLSKLLVLGVGVILISQVSFLVLVWSDWRTRPIVWRLWWCSMAPSVFVTHLLLLRAMAVGRRGAVEACAGGFALWAGLMILWLGLRPNLFDDVSPVYLWVGAAPSAGTVLCTGYLVIRWLLGVARPEALARRALVAAMLASNLVIAVGGFYVGRATAGRGAEMRRKPETIVEAARRDLKEQRDRDAYLAQTRIATYLGGTRIVGRAPFIAFEQIDAAQRRLRPGDILLERRNWYLSNPFLPGFWPHAALYVGRIDDLGKLGLADHPAVRAHLSDYLKPAEDGQPKTVIEAVSEGVVLNTLRRSMHADYVAVLRPRLSDGQIAAAVARAFQSLGKPYDFNFDFDDTSKLVCTQVVYVAYEGSLRFELKRIMGRNTLPPVEIGRKYVAERGRPDRQLDFVLFLDGVPAEGAAREADEGAFCESCERPRALVERW